MAEPNTLVALESAWCGLKGESMMIIKGESFASDDPLVKLYPHLFGPAEMIRARAIEQATAAPGEKRGRK